MKEAGMILFFLIATASWVAAGERSSLARGEELFKSTKLGANGKSCADCHAGGKMLEKAAGCKEEELAKFINHCIKAALGGKPLAADSPDLASLVMYVKALAIPAKP